MGDAYDTIRAKGADLVAIGNGGKRFARAFMEERDVRFPIYVDPERVTYQAADMRRSLRSTFSPRTLKNGLRAMSSGHLQGATKGDPWQQGGVLVIAPGGETRLAYLSEEAGDHPSIDAILAVL
ncbi:MAG: peroxiredoxin-like family protein [Deltaproteobacteria bacterium]